MKLWESVDPPMGLLATGDEGASEIDVIIESASWVWVIEARYKSDISFGTTVRPDRDQILRNIDVGSHYAGVRQFFFTLLISDEKRTRLGMEKLKEYAELETLRSKLATHRGDRLINLQGIGHLTWQKTSKVLRHAQANANREDERCYARRALDWMAERKLTDEN